MTGARTIYRAHVAWMDTDAAGIYHHAAVVRYVEGAEAALARELGIEDYFSTVPRVHWEVDYESPLLFSQEVEVEIEVAHLGNASMTLNFEVWGGPFKGRPRIRAARGHYVVVHISGSFASGEAGSSRWPADWARALGGAPTPASERADPPRSRE
jgi:acyl-CoA thioester hydrolase